MKGWLVLGALIVVGISVIIVTIERSEYASEIYAWLGGVAFCGLPMAGGFVGWVLTMKTMQRATEMAAFGNRSDAARYGAIREGIKTLGRPQEALPALPQPPGAWLPPLQEWDVIDSESSEV